MRTPITKPDDFFEDQYRTYPVGIARTKDMLRYFFMLGYSRAADDAVDLMGDFAVGVAGCEAHVYRPEDIYDGVEADLRDFFSKQIGEQYDYSTQRI
jgi:hypothetical protein